MDVKLQSYFAFQSNGFVHTFTYIFFPSDNFFNIFKSKRITCTLLLSNKKYRLLCLFKRKRAFSLLSRFSFSEISFVVYNVGARAHLCALMTQKIVRSRDAQCNTVESPQRLTYRYRKTTLESLCWPVYDFFKLIASYLYL